jgi:hypothetical protein
MSETVEDEMNPNCTDESMKCNPEMVFFPEFKPSCTTCLKAQKDWQDYQNEPQRD